MTNDPLCAWAIEAWKKEALRNLPSVKLARPLKADNRESQKALARARRSLAASQAASKRKLSERLVEIERVSRERREVRDRELGQKRWEILTASR